MARGNERISFICERCGNRGTKRLIGPGSSRIWCARCENAVGNVDDKLDAFIEPTTAHSVEDGDGVCGDCSLCAENVDDVCIVAEKFRCAWCGHCTRTHAHRAAGAPDQS